MTADPDENPATGHSAGNCAAGTTDSGSGAREITGVLLRWQAGDTSAADQLMRLVYAELHKLADALLQRGSARQNLQATELINEVWLRLDQAELRLEHRRHFMVLSAQIMRQIIVDQARRIDADKRGGGWVPVTLSHLNESQAFADPTELLALEDSLNRLAELHPRAASTIELHYFGGMTGAEIAEHLKVTQRTTERDLRFGKAWLKDQLGAA